MFRVVDEEPFQKLLAYQRRAMKENDIPHWQKLQEEVIEKANEAIDHLTKHFEVCLNYISSTILNHTFYLDHLQSNLNHL